MAQRTSSVVRGDIVAIAANRQTTYWLREALVSALSRDPVDAARDAETAAGLLREYADALLRE